MDLRTHIVQGYLNPVVPTVLDVQREFESLGVASQRLSSSQTLSQVLQKLNLGASEPSGRWIELIQMFCWFRWGGPENNQHSQIW